MGAHYHGSDSGIEVLPTEQAQVDAGARPETQFSLVRGRVGRLAIQFDGDEADWQAVELLAKAAGWAEDATRAAEAVCPNGNRARGLTTTRAAVRARAVSEVFTTADRNGPDTIGHIDCAKIVRGAAMARNVPLVVVRDDRARVTHKAATGRVGRTELETLMARGLAEDEAIDIMDGTGNAEVGVWSLNSLLDGG